MKIEFIALLWVNFLFFLVFRQRLGIKGGCLFEKVFFIFINLLILGNNFILFHNKYKYLERTTDKAREPNWVTELLRCVNYMRWVYVSNYYISVPDRPEQMKSTIWITVEWPTNLISQNKWPTLISSSLSKQDSIIDRMCDYTIIHCDTYPYYRLHFWKLVKTRIRCRTSSLFFTCLEVVLQ